MKKFIIVTSINKPTLAVESFEKLSAKGWNTVVVGDLKTPSDWHCGKAHYLDVAKQRELYPKLSESIPYNHYCRKNLGYLYAIHLGADLILDTDDDNIPLHHFGEGIDLKVSGDAYQSEGWLNVYKHFSDAQCLWPRGLPLPHIQSAGSQSERLSVDVPIQQFMADLDPDVDSIYRLLFKDEVVFKDREPILLGPGCHCPFNSQNTVFFKEAFPLLYLPCHVSFRMTDIWRSFVAQIALHHFGRYISFHKATVKQIRNEHNLMTDFEQEVVGYLHNDRIMKILMECSRTHEQKDIGALAKNLWESLVSENFVTPAEIKIHQEWMLALGH